MKNDNFTHKTGRVASTLANNPSLLVELLYTIAHQHDVAESPRVSGEAERLKLAARILEGTELPGYEQARKMHHSVKHENGKLYWTYDGRSVGLDPMEAHLIGLSFVRATGALAVWKR